MNFKVGDICKVREEYVDACGDYTGEDADSVRITSVSISGYAYDILKDGEKVGHCGCYDDDELITSKGRPAKPKPVLFVAVYDKRDIDPAEVFTSEKDMKDWLRQARKDSNVLFDTIRVFKVTDEYGVLTSFSLKKK